MYQPPSFEMTDPSRLELRLHFPVYSCKPARPAPIPVVVIAFDPARPPLRAGPRTDENISVHPALNLPLLVQAAVLDLLE
jgi:hypothetical protein